MIHELPPDMRPPAHLMYSEVKPGINVLFAVPPDQVQFVMNNPQYLKDLQDDLASTKRFMRFFGWYLKLTRRYGHFEYYCVQQQAEINLIKLIIGGNEECK